MPQKNALVEAVLAQLKSEFSAARLATAQTFAGLFFRRVPDEDIAARDLADWVGLARDALDFVQVRTGEQSLVRVYNPNRGEHGWESSHTVVQVLTDDMPFLVDSVTMAISACDNLVQSVVHPVLQVDRDAGGHVLGMNEESAAGGRGKAESFMHFEVDRRADP
ncbi:MAG TPA: NAD-glutamate dehydrogenase, partial [Pseudomonadota bacterium]|nr:NAD-glutamate dehydrogenase [Pseudomonadota bacterium]